MKAILLTFVLMTFSFADKHDGVYIKKDFVYLGLKKEQIKSIKKALIAYRKKMKQIHEESEYAEKKFEKKFEKSDFKARDYINFFDKLKIKQLETKGLFFESIHKVLTKKQRKKFANFIEEWEDD